MKYLIKSPQADTMEAARNEGVSQEKVSSYELSQLSRAFNASIPGSAYSP
jgi:hypothetical protein